MDFQVHGGGVSASRGQEPRGDVGESSPKGEEAALGCGIFEKNVDSATKEVHIIERYRKVECEFRWSRWSITTTSRRRR